MHAQQRLRASTANDPAGKFDFEGNIPIYIFIFRQILIDDAGFGQFSKFGEGIPSLTMDQLAAEGLRYNRFHTTALCSPTRAALLTGRNHRSVRPVGFRRQARVADHSDL